MKISHRLRLALAAGLVSGSALSGPAAAQAVPVGQEGELAKLLPPVHGRKVCYARTYDATHLKKHPKQKVTALLFQLKYHRHSPDDGYPQEQRNYYFAMSAKVKGQPKTLYSGGECTSGEGGMGCGVDCDGGGVNLARDPRTGDLIISFAKQGGRIRMTPGCGGEEDSVDLEPGADDKVFRLERADLSACRALNRHM